MKLLIGLLVIWMFITACASLPIPWYSVPESNVPYDMAWEGTVEAVRNQLFTSFEVLDKEKGQIRSHWIATFTCWRDDVGFLGAVAPCKFSRITLQVDNRNPFAIKIKAEKKEWIRGNKWIPLRGYSHWEHTGDDYATANRITEHITDELRRLEAHETN